MRDDFLSAISLLVLVAVAGAGAYSAVGANQIPRGILVVLSVLWAMLPLCVAYGLAAAGLFWLWGWLAGVTRIGD
jgi:hypothetical protein